MNGDRNEWNDQYVSSVWNCCCFVTASGSKLSEAAEKEKWLMLVHISVLIVNTGYFALSVSAALQQALWANRLAYLGSVFLPLFMLMAIMDVCQIRCGKGMFAGLLLLSIAVFLLAASGGYVDWYYKEVSFTYINGAAKLVKEYGTLHVLYLVYLLSYFAAMAGVILYSILKKNVTSHKLAYSIVQEEQVSEKVAERKEESEHETIRTDLPQNMEELFSAFAEKMETLSAAEKRIFTCYLEGYDAAGITEKEFISLSTVRKHSGNIYRKLEISSRDELMLYVDLFRRCDRMEQLKMKLD